MATTSGTAPNAVSSPRDQRPAAATRNGATRSSLEETSPVPRPRSSGDASTPSEGGNGAATPSTSTSVANHSIPVMTAPSLDSPSASDEEKHVFESFPSVFASWDALDAYLREFMESVYQLFKVRNSIPIKTRNEALEARNAKGRKWTMLPEEWRYYQRIYACTHAAAGQRRGKGVRNHALVRDMGCTAKIKATLQFADARYFIAVQLDGFHNHPCDRERYFAYPENRRIKDPALQRFVLRLHDSGASVQEIHARVAKRIKEITGEDRAPTRKDLQNYIRRWKLIDAAAANHSDGAAQRTDGHAFPESDDDGGDDSSSDQQEQEPGGVDNQQQSSSTESRKRRAEDMTQDGNESEGEHETIRPQSGTAPVRLSRLEAMLASRFCYQQIHDQIDPVEVARAEGIPRSISGFNHEIVRLSTATNTADSNIAFILPKYVIYGCENEIVTYCRYHGLHPSSIGVALPVTLRQRTHQGSQTFSSVQVTISSRQIRAMKLIHHVRQTIRDVKSVIDWIHAKTFRVRSPPPPSFDEYYGSSKDTFLDAVQFMPLMKTVVRGDSINGDVKVRFTDSILGTNLLRFGSSTSTIDVDCVKAIILHMHARFHATARFVCPSFLLEPGDDRERWRRASAYGALTTPTERILGVTPLTSVNRWGAFFLNRSRIECTIYAASESDFAEMKEVLASLVTGFDSYLTVQFAPSLAAAAENNASIDSGILALLFLECILLETKWADIPIESLDYYRVRYLMQAIQVVNRQDVHDIQWS